MKNKIVLFSIAIMISLFLISGAYAGVGFKEYSKLDSVNNISRIYGFMQFGSTFVSFPTSLCFYSYCYTAFVDYSDYVPLGQPFQAYIEYGMTPLNEWNADNSNSTIDYCNIKIRETHQNSTKGYTSYISLDKTFTTDNNTITPNQYKQFISLQRGEYAEIFFDCHYTNSNNTILSPAEFSFVSPTYNCKACQYYENYKASADNLLGDIITTNTNEVSKNMQLFLAWNIDLWGTLFWILRILALVSVIGLVFIGMFWCYLFVKSFLKKT